MRTRCCGVRQSTFCDPNRRGRSKPPFSVIGLLSGYTFPKTEQDWQRSDSRRRASGRSALLYPVISPRFPQRPLANLSFFRVGSSPTIGALAANGQPSKTTYANCSRRKPTHTHDSANSFVFGIPAAQNHPNNMFFNIPAAQNQTNYVILNILAAS